jgi:PhoH-like ATPase
VRLLAPRQRAEEHQQIDDPHVDVFTNGLTYAVERFKEHPIAGHVTLVKGERSALATLSSRIL